MELTLRAAWLDFICDLHKSGRWKELSRAEKQALDKTNRIIRSGLLPMVRVRNAFERHSPGVYSIHVVTVMKRTDAL